MLKRLVRDRATNLKQLSGSAWALLEYGSYPLLLFIATPWFLHQLGPDRYGHWMLLTATVGLGGVLNTGTGAATIKAISAGIGRSNPEEIQHTVRVSLAVALLGGGVLAVLVFLLFSITGPTILARMGDPALIFQTGVAAAFLIWLEQLDNVFSSTIKGAEAFGQAARIEVASKATQIVAAAFVLSRWPMLSALYVTLIIIGLFRLIAKCTIAKRLLGLTNLRPTFSSAATILHLAKWGWVQGLGGMLFGVADRMLVGSLLGASSLSYYSIASQLAMQVHAISAAGLSVIFPKVSRKMEGPRHFSLWRVTKLTLMANFLLSSALAFGLLSLGPAILRSWIGAASATPTAALLPWLVMAYWVLALNIVPHYILLGMGQMRLVGTTALCCGIISVAAMYFAITHKGLIGAPVGRGTYALLSLTLFFPLVRYFAGQQRLRRLP
ncbi:lipopolysaccharide biosynthesis protein [Rhodanobacter sp. UC4437_H4]